MNARSPTALLLLYLSLVSCGEKPPTEVSIRLKWLHQAQFAGFYVAEQDSLYARAGIRVALRPGGVDYPAIQMVASGSDLFGVTGADQILIAREKGIPVVAVACIYRTSPFVLFALSKSGIANVRDFPGKRIGVKLGGNEELTYRAMLAAAGIGKERVKEIPVRFDISPLLTGQVDVWPGYSINEPITAQEQGHTVTLIWPRDYGLQLYADVLFTTEKTLREQRPLVDAVVAATVEGWQRAFADTAKAVVYTLRYSDQLRAEHEARMLSASRQLVMPDSNPIGWMDRAIWTGMHDLMRKSGFLKADVDIQAAYRNDLLPSFKSGR